MTIKATVVNGFKENAHDGHIYRVGEIYPAEGFEATEERVTFLADIHPKYKKIYLANVELEEQNESVEFPKHLGGGTYELSNGEKVKGKDEATEAENQLKQGE